MRVFKTTYQDRKGKTRETSKWYVEWTDQRDTTRRLAGFVSKAATEELGRNLDRLTSYHRATGGQVDPALTRWLADLPPSVKRGLVRLGLLPPERAALAKALKDHVTDFVDALKAKGGTGKHAGLVESRLRRVVDECGFSKVGDISAARISGFLGKLREDEKDTEGKVVKRGMSAQTANFYVGTVNQFCRWLVRERRTHENPVAHMDRWNVRTDRRHDRRALTLTEVGRLLAAAADGPDKAGVPGPTRAMFYRLAVETGLRAGELRSLTRASLDLGQRPTVTVEAAYAKNRRRDTLPLRHETAAALRAFTATHAPSAPLFRLPHPDTLIDLLTTDLKAAGIPYEQDGKYADLHALRHTCGSWLAAAGVHPKTIQRILRHSTITLTLDRYTHAFMGDEAAAVAKLPSLTTDGPERLRATGTDCATVSADCLAQLGGLSAAPTGAGGRNAPTLTLAGTGGNSAENAGFCPDSPSGNATRPIGFEPMTCGLGNRPEDAVKAENTGTCETRPVVLADCLAHFDQNAPDLAAVVRAWADLPPGVRAGIASMVAAVHKGS